MATYLVIFVAIEIAIAGFGMYWVKSRSAKRERDRIEIMAFLKSRDASLDK